MNNVTDLLLQEEKDKHFNPTNDCVVVCSPDFNYYASPATKNNENNTNVGTTFITMGNKKRVIFADPISYELQDGKLHHEGGLKSDQQKTNPSILKMRQPKIHIDDDCTVVVTVDFCEDRLKEHPFADDKNRIIYVVPENVAVYLDGDESQTHPLADDSDDIRYMIPGNIPVNHMNLDDNRLQERHFAGDNDDVTYVTSENASIDVNESSAATLQTTNSAFEKLMEELMQANDNKQAHNTGTKYTSVAHADLKSFTEVTCNNQQNSTHDTKYVSLSDITEHIISTITVNKEFTDFIEQHIDQIKHAVEQSSEEYQSTQYTCRMSQIISDLLNLKFICKNSDRIVLNLDKSKFPTQEVCSIDFTLASNQCAIYRINFECKLGIESALKHILLPFDEQKPKKFALKTKMKPEDYIKLYHIAGAHNTKMICDGKELKFSKKLKVEVKYKQNSSETFCNKTPMIMAIASLIIFFASIIIILTKKLYECNAADANFTGSNLNASVICPSFCESTVCSNLLGN